MIRYQTTEDELAAQIDALAPTWRQRARDRTETFRALGMYQESSSIWGEIKLVYMTLQFSKCAYCERKLEEPPLGPIEHDIEHFRPKSGVAHWPTADDIAELNLAYAFSTGAAWTEGYYLLAYQLLNYATACKTCNSRLKSNYFPALGPRGPQSDDCRTLMTERPLLIYPIDDVDTDPEELIGFVGLQAVPRYDAGDEQYRARVTIDFFRLNRREELRKQRAMQIFLVGVALQQAEQASSDAEREMFTLAARVVTGSDRQHANCARSYFRLFHDDRARAQEIYAQAWNVLYSAAPQ